MLSDLLGKESELIEAQVGHKTSHNLKVLRVGAFSVVNC